MVSQISPTSNCCSDGFAGQLSLNSSQSVSCAITERGKVAWIWAVVFAFAVPEVASFLMALRTIVMRSTSAPTIIELMVCLTFELLHTVGVAILFFIAFPGNDFCKKWDNLKTAKAIGFKTLKLRFLLAKNSYKFIYLQSFRYQNARNVILYNCYALCTK